ncbi:hypothetical protein CP532_3122 [Ophiocordyceps camponoti-leonardi (nom. inval.)]|nr:hypothetical protein CP532_3122 [Ophiocordyceps camponoti-leonardi (nom. inval.)]
MSDAPDMRLGNTFRLLSSATSDNSTARLGRLALAGRRIIETPNYAAVTSRGCVPHLTPDSLSKHTSLGAAYMALEDFVERRDPPIYDTPPGDNGRLHSFTALASDRATILAARRCPPVLAPMGNTRKAVTLFTSTGFSRVTVAEFAEAAKRLRPDVIVALGETLHTSTTPSSKKALNMTQRTEDWLDEFLHHLGGRQGCGDKGISVFAPVLPIDFTLQWSYLNHLEDVTDELSGLAIYDVRILPDLVDYPSLSPLPKLSLDVPKTPHDVLRQVALGVDICTIPFINSASDAGVAFTFAFPPPATGKAEPMGLNMWSPDHAASLKPLLEGCRCYACTQHHRAYLHHLLSAKEMLGWTLLQIHNQHVVGEFFAGVRRSLGQGLAYFEQGIEDFAIVYHAQLPEGSGQRPRARGYHFKSEAGQEKINNSSWTDFAVDLFAPRMQLAAVFSLAVVASASTFQRLGACPSLGCLLPPDRSDFLAGQLFDLRVEVHAPVNGSEAAHGGIPDEAFTVTISAGGAPPRPLGDFFQVKEPHVEKWQFQWYEDLFAVDSQTPSVVNVASKAYRSLAMNEPGTYEVMLSYYGGEETKAQWTVRPRADKKAKNVILFIGDGMTTPMITAARLLAHGSINGKYQSRLKMDEFPVLGHQMTHSIDSYLTDSANSASALYSGHKCTVNAMGIHADSSPDPLDDPKVETIAEIFSRVRRGAWGAVSTAFLADATPIALTGHVRRRFDYATLIDQALNGISKYKWSPHKGPDVFFGGGAEQFYPGFLSYEGKDYYAKFAAKGYSVSLNRTSLLAADTSKRALGVFCQGSMPVWLDRNEYKDNLETFHNDPRGGNGHAGDLPGLKDMTFKAIDVLNKRGGDKGFFLMSEAASIDKQMHNLDYDRALGDLLELDDTVRGTIDKLGKMGILDETLVIVTADHGHGFDVWGSADTKYLEAQQDDRAKRNAIGVYDRSGQAQYSAGQGPNNKYGANSYFPSTWEPRYAIAAGVGAAPDHRENFRVHRSGPRQPAVMVGGEFYANPKDSPAGFVVNGTLPTKEGQGVHSLTDVPIYALGPCQEAFGGTYDNTDVFYKIASCLGLAPESERSRLSQ